MNIKSLLLGSAAAMVAVSGARAADAVVIPEPEAVEYVRVCDAAGAGYFYIPGGETCLKISGYVRYQISTSSDELSPGNEGWNKDTEARILFNSWRDSAYGAVTANIRLDGNIIHQDSSTNGSNSNALAFDRAYLTIGGLNMGLDTNAYDFDQDGAADTLTANGTDRNQISYTANFGAGSFRLQLLEDGNENYVPNVIGVLAFAAGDFGVTAAVAYDDGNNATIAGDDSWGAKVAVTYAGFGAHVAYSSEAGNGGDYSANYDWVIGANYGFDATDKLNINIAGVVGLESADYGDTDYVLGVEAAYALTETFSVSARARYFSDVSQGAGTFADDVDGWDGRIRFTSSF